MPIRFQPGDHIHHRNSKTIYQVLYIRPDGYLVVLDRRGLRRSLTRPEEYRHAEQPDRPAEGPAPLPAPPRGD